MTLYRQTGIGATRSIFLGVLKLSIPQKPVEGFAPTPKHTFFGGANFHSGGAKVPLAPF